VEHALSKRAVRRGSAITPAVDAFWALIETNPTTFTGAVALLTFLNELAESDAWLFAVRQAKAA
jgi:hypothetical protein